MDKTTIINLIKANIKPNGMMEITGQVLQDVLVRMINDSVANVGDLTDVTITDAKDGQILQYKDGKWVNVDNLLSALADVLVSGAKAGQALVWNGTKWTNGDVAAAGATYTVMTQAAYDQAYGAGSLDDKMLYIIID